MSKPLPLVLRHAMYNLRGGFLIRPLTIALSLGCAGAFLSWLEEEYPTVSAWVPSTLFPSHADPQIAQMQSGLDVYGHPKNYVQALSVGTYETNNAALVDDGIALDKALAAYQQQKDAQSARMAALNNSVQQAGSQITKNASDRNALISQGGH